MWLFTTDGTLVPLVLRLTLAIVMFPHGVQKVFGWFGGQGLRGTLGSFGSQGIPAPLALVAIAAEFLGSLGLAVGLLARVAAFGIACVMVVAVLTVHARTGFFMNWSSTQKGEGFEFHLLAIGIAVALVIGGAGRWSLDALIAR
jgi:putative oxidoreductase